LIFVEVIGADMSQALKKAYEKLTAKAARPNLFPTIASPSIRLRAALIHVMYPVASTQMTD
jgi:hypothetical protein